MKKAVILGLTGAAVTAGALATGVALSNKKNRRAVSKGVKSTVKKLGDVQSAIADGAQRYQAFSQRVRLGKKTGTKNKVGRRTH